MQALKMFNQKPEFRIEIASQTRYLKMVVELTRNIAQFVGFSSAEAQKIALAIDEAVTNIIKHSYNEKPSERIVIEYFLHNRGIKIVLTYQGLPPEISDSQANLQELIKSKSKGGLGLKLMRSIMDEVSYRTAGTTNYCEMIKWKKTN